MGRRKILTDAQEQEICKLLAQNYTSKEIALKYSVDKKTIDRLRVKPEIRSKVQGLTLDEIREVLEKYFKAGSTADRELYLKYIQKWNPAQKVEVDANNKVEISFTDLVKAEKAAKDNGAK